MTCRKCAIENCEVLLTTKHPMCLKHWSKVPQPVVKALDAAVRDGMQARDDVARQRAKTEYEAAWVVAVEHASNKPVVNLGRTAAGPGPNDGPRVGA